MKKITFAAVAAIALSASPALACEVTAFANGEKAGATNRFNPQSAGDFASRYAEYVIAGNQPGITIPAVCRQAFIDEMAQINGWDNTTTWEQVGATIRLPAIMVASGSTTSTAVPTPSSGGTQVAAGANAMQAQINALESRVSAEPNPEVRAELERMLGEARETEASLAERERSAQATLRTLQQQRSVEPLTTEQVQQLTNARNALSEIREARTAIATALEQAQAAATNAQASATAARGSASAAETSATSAAQAATAAASSAQEAKNASWKLWEIALIALGVFLLLVLPSYFLVRKGLAKKTELDAFDKKTMLVEPTPETVEVLQQMEGQDVAETQLLQFQRQDGEFCEVAIGRNAGSWICADGVGDHSDPQAPIKDIIKFVRGANRRGQLELSY